MTNQLFFNIKMKYFLEYSPNYCRFEQGRFFLTTPAVTRGHGFCDLIIRTPLFICLASTTCRENRVPILICLPKGFLALWLPYLTCMIVPCENCESVTFILVLSLVLSTHCLINHLYWSYLTWVDEPKSFTGPAQGQTVGRNSRSRS